MSTEPQEYTTRLSASKVGFPGILIIHSYINAQGKVEHNIRGADYSQPKGQQDCDLTFPTDIAPAGLKEAHEREVRAQTMDGPVLPRGWRQRARDW